MPSQQPIPTPPKSESQQPRRWHFHALVAVVAIIASAAGILNDFVYDDVPLIRDNARLHSLAHWGEILTRPYWPPPFVQQLYRPASSLLLAIQYAIGDGSPIVFRIASYVLYAACAIGVFRLATRVVSCRVAVGIAVLFAVHPVHVEAVALGVNQGELVVGLAALVMVCLYLDRRRAGRVRARDWLAIAGLYALAALSKENGFVLPGLLIAAEVLLVTGESPRARLRALSPGYAMLAAVAFALVTMRATVLAGHVTGAVAAEAFDGLGLGGRVMLMLQVVPMWLRLLVWPARLQADYAPGEIVAHSTLGPSELAGLAILFFCAVVAYRARRSVPVVSFGLVWCGIGLAPVSNIIPTGIVLAERTLFLPSIGLLIAVGGATEWLRRRAPIPTPSSLNMRRALLSACAGLAVLGVVRSVSRHLVWNSAHLRVVKRPDLRDELRDAGRRGTGQRGR